MRVTLQENICMGCGQQQVTVIDTVMPEEELMEDIAAFLADT